MSHFNWLWGRTGYSFIDYWTMGHFCAWVWLGTITAGLRFDRTYAFACCFGAALLWEVFETMAEKWWPSFATHPESLWNRWLSDPLMCVLGLALAWYGFDHWRSPVVPR